MYLRRTLRWAFSLPETPFQNGGVNRTRAAVVERRGSVSALNATMWAFCNGGCPRGREGIREGVAGGCVDVARTMRRQRALSL